MEQRIIELEMKLAFQETAMQTLSDELAAHREQLAVLKQWAEHLQRELSLVRSGTMPAPDKEPPPPHY